MICCMCKKKINTFFTGYYTDTYENREYNLHAHCLVDFELLKKVLSSFDTSTHTEDKE